MSERINIIQADITTLEVGAIVNAANSSLLGGGGVDGAIHAAAGAELLKACRALKGCETGEAKLTPGFKLPAAHVIHTVGPVWSGGERGEDALLASCYRSSMELARDHALWSLAFPAISTGIYGFPGERAAHIAVATVLEILSSEPRFEDVMFCCFDEATVGWHRAALERLGS